MIKKYTIEKISELENISQKEIRRQIAAGLLNANKKNNKYIINENAITDWKKSNQTLSDKETDWIKTNISNDNNTSNDIHSSEWVDISNEWYNPKKNNINYIELFAGAGGLSLGYKFAGLKGILANEYMEQAAKTYKHNLNHPIIVGDIRDQKIKQEIYDKAKNQEIDIISGGFPCKGFSLSGHRIVTDDRNNLYKDMLEIVDQLKPKFIIMENVLGLRSMLDGKVEEKILADFKSIGYNINVKTLNSADYYVPQVRKRVIFIGNRINKKNLYPKPLLKQQNYLTIKDAIKDLLDHPNDKEFNHVKTRHSNDMKKRISQVKEGKSLYDNYSDAWKKSPWNEPSCTIKENHGGVNLHPKLPRVITAREMARLQSFPDDFIFKGAKKWQLKQIGNAVPPLLGKALGLAVKLALK